MPVLDKERTKNQPEYDGWLLIDEEYTRESFKTAFEIIREVNKRSKDMETEIKVLRNRIQVLEADILVKSDTSHTH